MSFSKWMQSTIEVEMISAEPLKIMNRINQAGIKVQDLETGNKFAVHFRIRRSDYGQLRKIVHPYGGKITIKGVSGIYWPLHSLLHRPILACGLLLLFALTLYIPTRVLFVKVIGNESVPERIIVDAAAECGIHFGAARRSLRSEKVKNALLEQLPQLQWLGVNTKGCVAEIYVHEKDTGEKPEKQLRISSIIASRDGVIKSLYVSRGTPQCAPGQVVKAGELLVSGYSDCGICIHGTEAEGEIYAETKHNFVAITPEVYQYRVENPSVSKKYSLIIGKKRINLYKGSGILDTTCGKMYEEYYITLPGGFQLPIGLETVSNTHPAVTESTRMPEDYTSGILREFSDKYLKRNMIAGEILRSDYGWEFRDGAVWLHGEYICREMIGRVRIEEIIE